MHSHHDFAKCHGYQVTLDQIVNWLASNILCDAGFYFNYLNTSAELTCFMNKISIPLKIMKGDLLSLTI